MTTIVPGRCGSLPAARPCRTAGGRAAPVSAPQHRLPAAAAPACNRNEADAPAQAQSASDADAAAAAVDPPAAIVDAGAQCRSRAAASGKSAARKSRGRRARRSAAGIRAVGGDIGDRRRAAGAIGRHAAVGFRFDDQRRGRRRLGQLDRRDRRRRRKFLAAAGRDQLAARPSQFATRRAQPSVARPANRIGADRRARTTTAT